MENFSVFKTKTSFILLSLIIVGIFLRFYNLTWGAPYFFHPDERNITSAISQLSFPSQMNPHFFAYGSLPIYIVYFTGVITNLIVSLFHPTSIFSVSFEQAIVIGRFLSALLSLGLIPLLFSIGKKLKDTNTGLLAAFLAMTSIGFLQYAHFSTFEMWLTFFAALLFYFCLFFSQKKTKKMTICIGLIFGVLMGIKVSSVVLLFPIAILFLLSHSFKKFIFALSFFCLSALCVFLISNPFVFLTPFEFLSSMQYESAVVLHTLPVFYTQGFVNTVPLVYQFLYVFPFILNPFLLIIFLPSFLYVIYKSITKRSFSLALLILFFFILLFSQGFFYAKWTRYMIPTLPFIYLILAIALIPLKKTIILSSIVVICSFYAFAFTYVVYVQPDTRINAMQWATKHIPPQTHIISEVYDLGIVPFNQTFPLISLVNFYEETFNQLEKNASIIILPSQRILKTRINNPKIYPKGFSFYKTLVQEKGYKKIYQTPCDIFCKIIYMGDPIFSVEETTNVFDRPTVYIFKKI